MNTKRNFKTLEFSTIKLENLSNYDHYFNDLKSFGHFWPGYKQNLLNFCFRFSDVICDQIVEPQDKKNM